MSKRFDLPNGEWVEFSTRINHAQQRRVQQAPPGERMDEGVAAIVLNWSLRDVDGNAIPFPGAAAHGVPVSALDMIPLETYALIAEEAAEVFTRAIALVSPPKAGGKPRPSSPPANGAGSSPSLPISTSSPTTPDGAGPISSPPLPT